MPTSRQRLSSASTRPAEDSTRSSRSPLHTARTGTEPPAMNTSKRASREDPTGRSATWVATVRPQRTSKTSACERPSGERGCSMSRDSHCAAAGALRTDSAYPRFLKASKASDALVSPTGTGLGGYYRALAHLPGAAEVAPAIGLSIQPAGHHQGGADVEAPADGRLWRRVEIPRVLAGRLPGADRAGEIAVDQNGAALLHLRV